jgi:hypothetical protein
MERILGNATVQFGLLDYNNLWSRILLQLSAIFKGRNHEDRNMISSQTLKLKSEGEP